MGRLCYDAEAAERDADAVTLFGQAAIKNHAGAQYYLGIFYDDGTGVKQDPIEAQKWFKKAAKQGHKEAKFRLGTFYAEGKGVKKDLMKALKWFKKAAEQGNDAAKLRVKELELELSLGVRIVRVIMLYLFI